MLALLVTIIFVTASPCAEEDVTGTVCAWDASERGNGIGADFVVIGELILYP